MIREEDTPNIINLKLISGVSKSLTTFAEKNWLMQRLILRYGKRLVIRVLQITRETYTVLDHIATDYYLVK